MAGFGRVHEERRRAGGRQRGGDLAADVPGLADAADDHPSAARQQQLARPREAIAQAVGESGDGVGLDLQDLARPGEQRAGPPGGSAGCFGALRAGR